MSENVKDNKKRISPVMTNHPEMGMVLGIIAYYLACFVFIPFLLPVFAIDSMNDVMTLSWFELGYHFANGIIVFLIIREHLDASLYYTETNVRHFIKTVLAGLGLSLIPIGAYAFTASYFGFSPFILLDVFPVSELQIFMMTGYLVDVQPILGTILMTVLAPVTVSGLVYAPGFAPLACKRPWLGYISVTLLLALMYGFEYLWHLTLPTAVGLFIIRLPVHLIACWTYQKTNSLLAPIAMLSVLNLASSLLCVFFY